MKKYPIIHQFPFTKSILFTSICVLLLFCITGCSSNTKADEPTTLNVFAAASLTEAFTELGQAFEAENPNANVAFNFAGSQQLAQQINEGAPADVFASANQKQMNAAITSERIPSDEVQIFAHNRLVVVYPSENPADIQQLQDLVNDDLKLVLADESVPVGQYSLDFLDKASQDAEFNTTFKTDVLDNVVSYEVNVKSVLNKVALGEADAGIVYSSDVIGPNAEKVNRLEIPDELNVIATYPIAALNDSQNVELAQAFVEFVLSDQGQTILSEYGLIPVEK
jgi:molybdate transport system substrate-binding protein